MGEQGTTRRTFYHRIIYGIWGLISGALALPAVAYLLFPFRDPNEGHWVDAGNITEMETNTPKEIVFQRTRRDGWKVRTENAAAWVIKTAQEEYVAYSPYCTHLGCAYRWDEKNEKFLCPCHDSFFAIDGAVLTGPSPRPLDRYEVRVEGNRLWLGRVYRSEEMAG